MKVTVVVPTCNRPQYLERLLESLRSQTYKKFQVIVVDDASRDLSQNLKVIQAFQDDLKLEFIRLEQGMGAPYCRNLGIQKAGTDFIALVDDDDFWKPQKLEKQVELLEQSNEKTGLVYTWTEVINEEMKVLRLMNSELSGNCLREILNECFVPSPSVMVTRKAIESIQGFDEELPSCQDWDTWIRMARAGFEFAVLKEPLTYYFKHSGPSIGQSNRAKLGYTMVYQKHFWHFLFHGQIRHVVRFLRMKINL